MKSRKDKRSAEEIEHLRKEIRRLKKIVYLDDLTKVYNRRGFLEIGGNFFYSFLESEKKKKNFRQKSSGGLSLVFLDLDDFKTVNDNHGHKKGDAVLKEVAGILKKTIRKTDIIGRLGGEEFAILLVDAPWAGAVKVAEKLKNDIAAKKIFGVKITASLGLIRFKNEKNLESLVDKADKLMYEAKKKGKNQLVFI